MPTKQEKENRTRMLLAFIRNAPHLTQERVSEVMDKLKRNDTTLNRINRIYCDIDLSERPKYEEKLKKQEGAAELRVTALVEELKFSVHFNGDPRGNAIQVKLPDGSSNRWDNETWGIDW